MSSICSAVLAKRSLTSMPLSPYRRNLNGEGNAAPVFRSVVKLIGMACPAYFFSEGLGSNVSTCEGPPFRKKWMTRFARPGKCCVPATKEDDNSPAFAVPLRIVSSENKEASPNAPTPSPDRCSNDRRLSGLLGRLALSISGIHLASRSWIAERLKTITPSPQTSIHLIITRLEQAVRGA